MDYLGGAAGKPGRFNVFSSCWSWGMFLFWKLAVPFRLIALGWRVMVALGVGVVRFGVELTAAVLGVTVALFVGYCVMRTLLHPLFQS
ncbi:hypothetical protein Q4S45_08255 [Massilia sp. R2A-15]|uniref:hypothetical protein n=1 Tax=Massilia sp. R2A-15 TaxID=3064278 RepID=UPI0027350059|nr:hypothetical protein [Massilia sp. R2A-15]WLI91097.1 hypothetical protein Q4S45_08255 [Massilia sp. R2A-15]